MIGETEVSTLEVLETKLPPPLSALYQIPANTNQDITGKVMFSVYYQIPANTAQGIITHEVGGKVMFSIASICLQGWSHVTITHDKITLIKLFRFLNKLSVNGL